MELDFNQLSTYVFPRIFLNNWLSKQYPIVLTKWNLLICPHKTRDVNDSNNSIQIIILISHKNQISF